MTFTTKDIPQADRLDKVVYAVEAVNEGATSDNEIAEVIGFTSRQARYYRHAAELLGFVTNDRNHADVTPDGKKLANSTEKGKIAELKKAVVRNGFLGAVLNFIERQQAPVSALELQVYLLSITDTEAHSTISRRISTILAWLEYLDFIIEDEASYRFNDELDSLNDENQPEESIYPVNYSQEVDIKEERFSVFELMRKLEQNKILMNPDFQRNLVWKQDQKSQFIESIILNVPLPPFYFRKERDGTYIIVDGLQRTSTLKEFLDPDVSKRFCLTGLNALPKLNDDYFQDLDDELVTRIEDKSLLVYVVQPSVPMVVVYDIFNRINTGGTQLERQEIRNCIFIGNATSLLKRLAENPIFRSAIDNGISPTRMKDREAILRCLAFEILDYENDYSNSMDDFLEKAMKRLNRMPITEVDQLEARFLNIMTLTKDYFQSRNFRLPSGASRGRINIAIMESVCNFFFKVNENFLTRNKATIVSNFYDNLLQDNDYFEAVRFSTGTTRNVKTRFSRAYQILSAV